MSSYVLCHHLMVKLNRIKYKGYFGLVNVNESGLQAKVEQMRAQAQAKMVEKMALARHKSEELRAAAEVRKSRQAEKTAAQVEYIRATGRIPSSPSICCGWS